MRSNNFSEHEKNIKAWTSLAEEITKTIKRASILQSLSRKQVNLTHNIRVRLLKKIKQSIKDRYQPIAAKTNRTLYEEKLLISGLKSFQSITDKENQKITEIEQQLTQEANPSELQVAQQCFRQMIIKLTQLNQNPITLAPEQKKDKSTVNLLRSVHDVKNSLEKLISQYASIDMNQLHSLERAIATLEAREKELQQQIKKLNDHSQAITEVVSSYHTVTHNTAELHANLIDTYKLAKTYASHYTVTEPTPMPKLPKLPKKHAYNGKNILAITTSLAEWKFAKAQLLEYEENLNTVIDGFRNAHAYRLDRIIKEYRANNRLSATPPNIKERFFCAYTKAQMFFDPNTTIPAMIEMNFINAKLAKSYQRKCIRLKAELSADIDQTLTLIAANRIKMLKICEPLVSSLLSEDKATYLTYEKAYDIKRKNSSNDITQLTELLNEYKSRLEKQIQSGEQLLYIMEDYQATNKANSLPELNTLIKNLPNLPPESSARRLTLLAQRDFELPHKKRHLCKAIQRNMSVLPTDVLNQCTQVLQNFNTDQDNEVFQTLKIINYRTEAGKEYRETFFNDEDKKQTLYDLLSHKVSFIKMDQFMQHSLAEKIQHWDSELLKNTVLGLIQWQSDITSILNLISIAIYDLEVREPLILFTIATNPILADILLKNESLEHTIKILKVILRTTSHAENNKNLFYGQTDDITEETRKTASSIYLTQYHQLTFAELVKDRIEHDPSSLKHRATLLTGLDNFIKQYHAPNEETKESLAHYQLEAFKIILSPLHINELKQRLSALAQTTFKHKHSGRRIAADITMFVTGLFLLIIPARKLLGSTCLFSSTPTDRQSKFDHVVSDIIARGQAA